MAESIEFKGVNRLFEMRPYDEEDGLSPMEPIPAFQGTVITYTCWRPSEEEMEEINRTGEVWMAVRSGSRPIQPHWLGSLSFIKRACAGMGSIWNPDRPIPPPPEANPSGLEPA